MSALSTNTTTAGYENTPLENTTRHQATFQPSTDYSLFQPITKSNSEMNVTIENASFSGWFTLGMFHTRKFSPSYKYLCTVIFFPNVMIKVVLSRMYIRENCLCYTNKKFDPRGKLPAIYSMYTTSLLYSPRS